MRIVNISLRSAFQNRGIASSILKDVIAEADTLQIPVYLDVDKTNDHALQIYLKFGFKIIKEDEIRYSLVHPTGQKEQ